jgi:putative FmdB family regulatory protein
MDPGGKSLLPYGLPRAIIIVSGQSQQLVVFACYLSETRRSRMPTYEYRCRDCHEVFDRVEALADHGSRRPPCPKCKSKNVEQVLTPFFAKTSHKS